ncbi:MAG: helix-turn-helix transcriptional regulator [Pseudomonadota bacterium]
MNGKALKYLRQYQRLTGVDYAERLGFAHNYISQVENRKKTVSMNMLEAYASDFGVPLSSLIAFCESVENLDTPATHMCDKMYKVYDWVIEVEEFHKKCES